MTLTRSSSFSLVHGDGAGLYDDIGFVDFTQFLILFCFVLFNQSYFVDRYCLSKNYVWWEYWMEIMSV